MQKVKSRGKVSSKYDLKYVKGLRPPYIEGAVPLCVSFKSYFKLTFSLLLYFLRTLYLLFPYLPFTLAFRSYFLLTFSVLFIFTGNAFFLDFLRISAFSQNRPFYQAVHLSTLSLLTLSSECFQFPKVCLPTPSVENI